MIFLDSNLRIILAIVAAAATIYALRTQIKNGLRPLHYAIIGLTVITATIHMLSGANDNLLFLNGLGYMLLLTGLYFVPLGTHSTPRKLIYAAFILYTLVTIGLYFVEHPWGMPGGEVDMLGWLTKIVEVLLIGLVGLDFSQTSRSQATIPWLEPAAQRSRVASGEMSSAATVPQSSNGNHPAVTPISDQPALVVNNLCFSYPDKPNILDGINVTMMSQERVGLIGPNGAGKTTFFMAICGVQKPDAGEITLFGQPLKHRDFRPEIGMVFQNSSDQLFSPTVRDDVAFGPQNLGLSPEEVSARVEEVLQLTGVSALADRPPHHLSGGEKRMVSIAGVLAMHPQLIIYDEPSANLDIRSRRRLIDFLKASTQAFIVSSHDLEFILEVCDRVILLDNGNIITSGPPVEVMRDAALMEKHGLERPHSLAHHREAHHTV